MPMTQGLQISAGSTESVLTPEQKRFNSLIKQIGKERETLAAWHTHIPLYRQAYGQVLVPLIESTRAARRDWVFALDRALGQTGWTKAERATLREVLCEDTADLLDTDEVEDKDRDKDLQALYDKHSDVDYETERKEARAALKEMVEAMTGVELGDDSAIESDEDLYKQMEARLRAESAARESAKQAHQSSRRAPRKSAAEQRREAEAQAATQSVREVYRKLASALHPDREPDPVAREGKNALMQKANQAYAANDLLGLLELQLQIEQVDAGHLATASAQRIKHYNQVLAEQLGQLRQEVAQVQADFWTDFNLRPRWGTPPKKLVGLITAEARDLRTELEAVQRDTHRLGVDKPAIKRWLKQERKRADEFDRDGDIPF